LRARRPAIVGRIAGGALVLDLRTLPPASDGEIVRALSA
jgi:hypothetical protein